MGTNYYLRKNICKCCNRYDEIHIGKKSYGWAFVLHITSEENINNLEDWLKLFESNDNIISNEYGKVLTVEEMKAIILDYELELSHTPLSDNYCIDNHETYDCCIGEFS